MANELEGKNVGFIVANEGVEQVELEAPWRAVLDEGANPVLIAPQPGRIQAYNHLDKGDTFLVDRTTGAARAEDFDAVVLPGGVANADELRTDKDAVALISNFFDLGRPVAVICHGPWTIVEADKVRGRTLTSWPSLQTDIRNAGGEWLDAEVHICQNGPNTLISSRKPDDLKAFGEALIRVMSAG